MDVIELPPVIPKLKRGSTELTPLQIPSFLLLSKMQ